ncbi:hypothetical protein V1280_001352 [Bradyrhizobium sp. AZCC 2230]
MLLPGSKMQPPKSCATKIRRATPANVMPQKTEAFSLRKRSQAYLARKAAERKAVQEARQQALPKSEQLPREYPRWFRVAKWIFGSLILGGLSFGASVYQIWGGPPWPTEPSVSAGPPSFGAAFDVPFRVENKSVFFSLTGLRLKCKVDGVLPGANTFRDNSFSAKGMNAIAPQSSAPYTCPLRGAISINGTEVTDTIRQARVTVIVQYNRRILGGIATAETGPYWWNEKTTPPHWEYGAPLK